MDVHNGTDCSTSSIDGECICPFQSPINDEAHDSNDEGTTIEISSAPLLGLDDDNIDDVEQPLRSNDFIMVIDDEEWSGP